MSEITNADEYQHSEGTTTVKSHDPHNGNSITRMEVSPNGRYIVTYSEKDHSIVGWNVNVNRKDKQIEKYDEIIIEEQNEGKLETDFEGKLETGYEGKLEIDDKVDKFKLSENSMLIHLCVSDNKEIAFILKYKNWNCLQIFDLKDKPREIKPYFFRGVYARYCTFSLIPKSKDYDEKHGLINKIKGAIKTGKFESVVGDNERNLFILYGNVYKDDKIKKIDSYLWVYSTRPTKNQTWNCVDLQMIPKEYDLVKISKKDKLYLLSDNSIYEWDFVNRKMSGSIFINEKEKLQKKDISKIRITTNENFICLRFKNDVIVYSVELDIPIASLNLRDGAQLLQNLANHPDLFPLLPSLFPLFAESCWKECLKNLEDKHLLTPGYNAGRSSILRFVSGYVFGIIDGFVWKVKLEGKLKTYDEVVEESDENKQDADKKKDDDKKGDDKKDDVEKDDDEKKYIGTCTKNDTYENFNMYLFKPPIYEQQPMHEQLPKYVHLIKFFENTLFNQDNHDDPKRDNDKDHRDVYIGKDRTIYIGERNVDHSDHSKDIVEESIPIYIEVPSKALMNDEHDDLFVHVKIPSNVPMDDRLEKYDEYESYNDDKDIYEKKQIEEQVHKEESKESVFVEVPTTQDDIIKIKITQHFKKDHHSNKWELMHTDSETSGKVKVNIDMSGDEKVEAEKAESSIKIINKKSPEYNKESKFNNKWSIICRELEKCNKGTILGIKLFDSNDFVVLTKVGFFIYYYYENTKTICLNYFYFMKPRHFVGYYRKLEAEDNLPPPNHESFKFDGWVTRVMNDKLTLLKYGVVLLTFAVMEHDIKLIDEIYKKCLTYFTEDGNNKMLLSIISSTMPTFEQFYPDYIKNYSLDTNMIIDSSYYDEETSKQENIILIERRNKQLHLQAFSQSPNVVDLTNSLWWTKYNYKFQDRKTSMVLSLFMILQFILVPLTVPLFIFIYFTFYLWTKFRLINDMYKCDWLFVIYTYINDKISNSKQAVMPTVKFMVPYIDFLTYPRDYSWFGELFMPKSSPFVNTINSDIYKTWSGEAILNFKWKTYGRYYYYTIWISFVALLLCFGVAATPEHFYSVDNKILHEKYIDENIRNNLLIASIVLGLIHLSFEVRQMIYNPFRWLRDPWNFFDLTAYVLPVVTAFRWLQSDDREPTLIAFSCLFLDIKFLLFLRGVEIFGVYFAIIVNVAKAVASFLVVLLVILLGFAHAFFILLAPSSDVTFENPPDFNAIKDDDYNPWNTPDQVLNISNGSQVPDQFMIAPPDVNTNMFIDFRTSLLAMYFFLTGDSSSLSNWTYIDHQEIVVMMVMFSFVIVVYLMNLFIGLLSNAIEENNNRVSFLMQKADILAEIELFYLWPHQRRWKHWFPEVLYYHAGVDKTRKKIHEIIKEEEWDTEEFKGRKEFLLQELKIKRKSED